jgi:hypothetical protein
VALPARGCGTDIRYTGDGTELPNCCLVEVFWNGTPQKVRVLYVKGKQSRVAIPSSAGTVKVGVNLRGPPRKAKYVQVTDSVRVP